MHEIFRIDGNVGCVNFFGWAPRLKACKEFVAAENKAGVKAQNVMLSDLGMPGASHMLMQDKNSVQIGKWLIGWINQNVKS